MDFLKSVMRSVDRGGQKRSKQSAKAKTTAKPKSKTTQPQQPETTLTIQEYNTLRNQLGVHIDDHAVPLVQTWAGLTRFGALPYLLRNIAARGYDTPTPIQMQAIPALLKGYELLASAPTGSGKTMAFLLPLLIKLQQPRQDGFRALVLAPTSELATQIHQELAKMCRGFRGGDSDKDEFRVFLLTPSNKGHMQDSAKRDILVSTPRRLVSLIEAKKIDLSSVLHVILDEADRLFDVDSSISEQIDTILSACSHKDVHRSLFSATLTQFVEELARTVLRNPVRIRVGQRMSTVDTVKQELLFVGEESGKVTTFRQLLTQGRIKPPCLVFLQSKLRVQQLLEELKYDQLRVAGITSDSSKAERDQAIQSFRSGRVWCLLCTDVLARGMDFKCIQQVVNWDFPTTVPEYIHRVGRCGRAGRTGEAISFFSDVDRDSGLVKAVANVVQSSGQEVPAWIMSLPAVSRSRRRELKKKPIKRKAIASIDKDTADKDKSKHNVKSGGAKNKKRRRRGRGNKSDSNTAEVSGD